MGGNTLIFYQDTHHWAWFIPLSDDVVSIGVVVPTKRFKENGEDPKELLRWGLEHINPDLERRVACAEQIEPDRFIR